MKKAYLLRSLLLSLSVVLFISCSGDRDEPVLAPSNKNLASITIQSKPKVLSYGLDEQIDLSGISVLGTYSDGTSKEVVVNKSNISGFDSSKANDKQQITITINGVNTTFDIKILPVRVSDGIITEVVSDDSSTKLELPNSVKSIPAKLFKYSPLTSIILNEGVVSIGEEAFACSQITSLQLPSSITSLGKKAFMMCDKLIDVDMSKAQLSTIEEGMFLKSNISSLKFPQKLTTIDDQAFCFTPNLKEVIIPEGVTKIGREAFTRSGIQKLKWANTVTKVGDLSFYLCSSLESVTTFGDNIKNEEDSYIGTSSFEHCSSLVTFQIPKSVKRLRQNMLGNNPKLTTLTLNSQIEAIDFNAMGNSSLKSVKIESSKPAIADYYIFPEKIESIIVPAGTAQTYKTAKGWSEFKLVINE